MCYSVNVNAVIGTLRGQEMNGDDVVVICLHTVVDSCPRTEVCVRLRLAA